MKRITIQKLAFLAAAVPFILSGCASRTGESGKPADETAAFAAVDYRNVCLLENQAVKSPQLVEAIKSGLERFGAKVERLAPGTGPGACPFVLTYEVEAENGVIKTIVYQTFENGIPRREARGTAPQGKGLTVGTVEAYTQELMLRLSGKKPMQGNAQQQTQQKPAYYRQDGQAGDQAAEQE